jgi:hypothetical protein
LRWRSSLIYARSGALFHIVGNYSVRGNPRRPSLQAKDFRAQLFRVRLLLHEIMGLCALQ